MWRFNLKKDDVKKVEIVDMFGRRRWFRRTPSPHEPTLLSNVDGNEVSEVPEPFGQTRPSDTSIRSRIEAEKDRSLDRRLENVNFKDDRHNFSPSIETGRTAMHDNIDDLDMFDWVRSFRRTSSPNFEEPALLSNVDGNEVSEVPEPFDQTRPSDTSIESRIEAEKEKPTSSLDRRLENVNFKDDTHNFSPSIEIGRTVMHDNIDDLSKSRSDDIDLDVHHFLGSSDEEYDRRFSKVKRFIPFLEITIEKHRQMNDLKSVKKMERIYEVLTQPNKKLKMETLRKLEAVLEKMFHKLGEIIREEENMEAPNDDNLSTASSSLRDANFHQIENLDAPVEEGCLSPMSILTPPHSPNNSLQPANDDTDYHPYIEDLESEAESLENGEILDTSGNSDDGMDDTSVQFISGVEIPMSYRRDSDISIDEESDKSQSPKSITWEPITVTGLDTIRTAKLFDNLSKRATPPPKPVENKQQEEVFGNIYSYDSSCEYDRYESVCRTDPVEIPTSSRHYDSRNYDLYDTILRSESPLNGPEMCLQAPDPEIFSKKRSTSQEKPEEPPQPVSPSEIQSTAVPRSVRDIPSISTRDLEDLIKYQSKIVEDELQQQQAKIEKDAEKIKEAAKAQELKRVTPIHRKQTGNVKISPMTLKLNAFITGDKDRSPSPEAPVDPRIRARMLREKNVDPRLAKEKVVIPPQPSNSQNCGYGNSIMQLTRPAVPYLPYNSQANYPQHPQHPQYQQYSHGPPPLDNFNTNSMPFGHQHPPSWNKPGDAARNHRPVLDRDPRSMNKLRGVHRPEWDRERQMDREGPLDRKRYSDWDKQNRLNRDPGKRLGSLVSSSNKSKKIMKDTSTSSTRDQRTTKEQTASKDSTTKKRSTIKKDTNNTKVSTTSKDSTTKIDIFIDLTLEEDPRLSTSEKLKTIEKEKESKKPGSKDSHKSSQSSSKSDSRKPKEKKKNRNKEKSRKSESSRRQESEKGEKAQSSLESLDAVVDTKAAAGQKVLQKFEVPKLKKPEPVSFPKPTTSSDTKSYRHDNSKSSSKNDSKSRYRRYKSSQSKGDSRKDREKDKERDKKKGKERNKNKKKSKKQEEVIEPPKTKDQEEKLAAAEKSHLETFEDFKTIINMIITKEGAKKLLKDPVAYDKFQKVFQNDDLSDFGQLFESDSDSSDFGKNQRVTRKWKPMVKKRRVIESDTSESEEEFLSRRVGKVESPANNDNEVEEPKMSWKLSKRHDTTKEPEKDSNLEIIEDCEIPESSYTAMIRESSKNPDAEPNDPHLLPSADNSDASSDAFSLDTQSPSKTNTLLTSEDIKHTGFVGAYLYKCRTLNCNYSAPNSATLKKHIKECCVINPRTTFSHSVVHPVREEKKKVPAPKFTEKESPKCVGSETLTFLPNEIDLLPLQAIYKQEVQCGACRFTTKVRTNIIRHLQSHAKNEPVPEFEPVNPVSCLDKRDNISVEVMNPESSSHKNGAKSKEPSVQPEDESLPKYVPENKRYVCVISECSYFTSNEGMLIQHLKLSHSEEPFFKCTHCKAQGQDVQNTLIKEMEFHLKMHDSKLYKCWHCNYFHYQRYVVQRHLRKKHPTKTPFVKVIREFESTESSQSSTLEENKDETPDPYGNYWKCNSCDYKCVYKAEMQAHVGNEHDEYSQYNCTACSFIANGQVHIIHHINVKHSNDPELNYQIIYQRIRGTKKLTDPVEQGTLEEAFDTTPLWRKDMLGVKHIRGILFKEEPTKKASHATPTTLQKVGKRKSDTDISAKPDKVRCIKPVEMEKLNPEAGGSGTSKSTSPLKQSTPRSPRESLLNTPGPEIIEEGSSSGQPKLALICKHCKRTFNNKRGFKIHVSKQHLKQEKFSCPLFDCSADLEFYIQQRIQSKHPVHFMKPVPIKRTDEFWLKEYEVSPRK